MRKILVLGYNIIACVTMLLLVLSKTSRGDESMVAIIILLGTQIIVNIVDDIADKVL